MHTPGSPSPSANSNGFTLLELLLALTIAGLVLAVSVPSSMRLYDSMQYRSAVSDALTLLASARHAAAASGVYQDVEVNPRDNLLRLNDTRKQLPGQLRLAVHSARELNRQDAGVIRFYPEGGSSGGGLDIERPNGSGVRINVDWLAGRVSQESYAPD
jgi:general secretion pathway protein H